MLKYILSLLFFISLSGVVDAQTVQQYQKAAESALAEGALHKAAFYFEEALKLDGKRVDLRMQYANCLRLTNNYTSALTEYQKSNKQDKHNRFPLAEFYIAELNKIKSNYQEALNSYKLFMDSYKSKDRYAEKARMEIVFLSKNDFNPLTDTSQKVEALGDEINKPFADLAWNYDGASGAYFTGSRKAYLPEKKDSLYPTFLFELEHLDTGWIVLDSTRFGNRKYQVGSVTEGLNENEKIISLCYRVTDAEWRCGLYTTAKTDTLWSKPKLLGKDFIDSNYTFTHPHLATLSDGKNYLFYVSDKKGGIGGLDIWFREIKSDGSFGTAYPLSDQINSPFDEASPYFDPVSGKLYFSSEWHGSLGAYDIFSTPFEIEQTKFEIENAGKPINSPYNDLFFSLSPDRRKIMVTSNREGSRSYRGEACCPDLWRISLPEPWDTATGLEPDTPLLAELPPDSGISIDTASSSDISTPDSQLPPEEQMKQMLPLTVYFHNDEPEPNTLKKTTWKGYRRTYNEYLALRDEYLQVFPSESADSVQAANSVEAFFEDEVIKGMNDLYLFCSLFEEVLESGKTVEVQLKAHCSPLALNDYNINLAHRRIESVMIFFEQYNGGVFADYAEQLQLSYPANAVGEEEAPEGVNDNPEEVAYSIYSPKASLERRVEILGVVVK